MYILDTNIVSELVRPTPYRGVVDWIHARATTALYTTAVTQAELFYGIAIMPDGKRKDGLKRAINIILIEGFQQRILTFSEASAVYFAEIAAQRIKMGRPMAMADAQIAAICREYRYALVTRNISDFSDCEIELVNPFRL
jgi:predicted nucleic acid-binding protein